MFSKQTALQCCKFNRRKKKSKIIIMHFKRIKTNGFNMKLYLKNNIFRSIAKLKSIVKENELK